MSVKVTRRATLIWDETTPGVWRWLTFGQLCEIAEAGKKAGIDNNCFVYFHPEYADDEKKLRADQILIDNEQVERGD